MNTMTFQGLCKYIKHPHPPARIYAHLTSRVPKQEQIAQTHSAINRLLIENPIIYKKGPKDMQWLLGFLWQNSDQEPALDILGYGYTTKWNATPPVQLWHMCNGKYIDSLPLNERISRIAISTQIISIMDLETELRKRTHSLNEYINTPFC